MSSLAYLINFRDFPRFAVLPRLAIGIHCKFHPEEETQIQHHEGTPWHVNFYRADG